jgi:hypothetical protein
VYHISCDILWEEVLITVKRVAATMKIIEVAVRRGDEVCGDSISPVGGMDRMAGGGG